MRKELFSEEPLRFDEMGALVCPWCENNCLHHCDVNIFDRDQDADITSVVSIDTSRGGCGERGRGGSTPVSWRLAPSDTVANPSSRRGGITIKFRCEFCPADLTMTIAQHKGHTLAQWRINVSATVRETVRAEYARHRAAQP